LYGEDRLEHEGILALLVLGEPEHLEGVDRTAALEILVSHPDETVGIARGLEDPPRSLDLPAVEQLVALAVELRLALSLHALSGGVGGLDEAFTREAIESFFVHTLAVQNNYTAAI